MSHFSSFRLFRCILFALFLVFAGSVSAASEAEEYLAEARMYLGKGETRAAVIELKNALKADPTNVQARLLLGSIQLSQGDAAGAAKELKRAGRLGADKKLWLLGYARALAMQSDYGTILEEIVPDDDMTPEQVATVLAIRGNALLATGRRDEGVAAYEKALETNPRNPLARLGKASILLQDGDNEAALAQFNAVLDEYPDHVQTRLARAEVLRAQQQYEQAKADFDKVIEMAPAQARAYVGRALVAIAQGQPEAALEDARTLAKYAKGQPVVHYVHALAAYQLQDFETASDQLQLMLRLVPGNTRGQMLYGIVSYAKGDYTLADEYLTRSVAESPDNLPLAKLVAASRLKMRQPGRAVQVLESFVSGETRDAQLLALLGAAYLQQGDNTRGSDLMERAVELSPDQALLLTQLAVGRIAAGNTEDAIHKLESAVDLGQDLIQADVLLVLSYLKQKDYAKAETAARKLEERMPDSPIPANLAGLAFMARQELDQARAKFEQAIAIDAGFVVARMNLARLALVRNDAGDARAHYERVLESAPEHGGAMLGLAALEQAAGNSQQAEAWLLKANKANPEAVRPILLLAESYLRQNQALKANNLLSGLGERESELPPALRLRGMAQLQSGEFSSAVRTLQRLTVAVPDNVEAWFQLARAQAAAGDTRGSRTSFRKGIELDADRELPILWVGLGELELREKNYDAALAHARRMQALFPGNAMAYEIEAAAYRGKGQINLALAAVERAVRVEGNSKRVNLFAHTLAASGKMPEAVVLLREWVADNPNDGVAWTTLGMMQQQTEDVDGALDAYEKALALSGGNPVILNNMAWLYLDRQPERARQLASEAYTIAPERAEIVDTYGWIEFKKGDARKGLNLLQQALVLAPKNAEIGLHVAEALYRSDRSDEALPLLERVIRENADTRFEAPAKELLNKIRP